MPEATGPVWFVTGGSAGFGRAIAETAIARGCRVVVTARDPSAVADLQTAHPDAVLALALDVTDRGAVDAAVGAAKDRFGRIDVLVNNAGRGYLSAVEEGEEDEIRGLFETNFFGLVWTIQAVLPLMRAQRSGCVVNISSVGGLTGNLGHGYYGATKFAIEGLSDSLSKELGPLGLHVLLIEPGSFRTDFFKRSIRQSKHKIDDYAQSVGKRLEMLFSRVGTESGDPHLGAELIADAVDATMRSKAEPRARRVVMGKIAMEMARGKIADVLAEIALWEQRSIGTDIPK